jgi:hypothetical protein
MEIRGRTEPHHWYRGAQSLPDDAANPNGVDTPGGFDGDRSESQRGVKE